VVALVFGSIAILEYRQNRFIVALLRSFGAPAPLLLLRYAAEALLLVAVALLLVRQGIVLAHPALFALAGFEPGLLDRAVLDPYAWPAVWPQARWLLLGAALGVLPVAFALRQPVGKILQ
jgi:predicted lysophospholipase L1 biosynthesis ABC-type transport system permease subunit